MVHCTVTGLSANYTDYSKYHSCHPTLKCKGNNRANNPWNKDFTCDSHDGALK
jgi:hypothetical protein